MAGQRKYRNVLIAGRNIVLHTCNILVCVLAILSQILKEDKVPGLLRLNILSFTGAKSSRVLLYNFMLAILVLVLDCGHSDKTWRC